MELQSPKMVRDHKDLKGQLAITFLYTSVVTMPMNIANKKVEMLR